MILSWVSLAYFVFYALFLKRYNFMYQCLMLATSLIEDFKDWNTFIFSFLYQLCNISLEVHIPLSEILHLSKSESYTVTMKNAPIRSQPPWNRYGYNLSLRFLKNLIRITIYTHLEPVSCLIWRAYEHIFHWNEFCWMLNFEGPNCCNKTQSPVFHVL